MTEEMARIEKSFIEYEKASPLGRFDVDFGALGRDTSKHSELDKMRCGRNLDGLWLLSLTNEEAALWRDWPDLPKGPLLASMNQKLDRIIIEAADKHGWPFITYFPRAGRRMADWYKEPDGPRLAREFGEALAHGIECELAEPYEGGFVQDDGKWKAAMSRLDHHACEYMEKAIQEWRLLRDRVKCFQGENPTATIEELLPFIKSHVLDNSETYRLFGIRLSGLEEFLRFEHSKGNLDRTLRRRPEGFVIQWMSFQTGRDPVSLRNAIRDLGKEAKQQSLRK